MKKITKGIVIFWLIGALIGVGSAINGTKISTVSANEVEINEEYNEDMYDVNGVEYDYSIIPEFDENTGLPLLVGGTRVYSDNNDDSNVPVTRTCQEKPLNLPDGFGKLWSNTWRSRFGKIEGHTIQWDYLTRAKYEGNKKVFAIRTTWTSSATLKNSASMSVAASGGDTTSVEAGGSSSWQSITSGKRYLMNTKGQKEAFVRGNVVIGPEKHYDRGTFFVTSTASIAFKRNGIVYRISSGV